VFLLNHSRLVTGFGVISVASLSGKQVVDSASDAHRFAPASDHQKRQSVGIGVHLSDAFRGVAPAFRHALHVFDKEQTSVTLAADYCSHFVDNNRAFDGKRSSEKDFHRKDKPFLSMKEL
jgi:hypothetical protein